MHWRLDGDTLRIGTNVNMKSTSGKVTVKTGIMEKLEIHTTSGNVTLCANEDR